MSYELLWFKSISALDKGQTKLYTTNSYFLTKFYSHVFSIYMYSVNWQWLHGQQYWYRRAYPKIVKCTHIEANWLTSNFKYIYTKVTKYNLKNICFALDDR